MELYVYSILKHRRCCLEKSETWLGPTNFYFFTWETGNNIHINYDNIFEGLALLGKIQQWILELWEDFKYILCLRNVYLSIPLQTWGLHVIIKLHMT